MDFLEEFKACIKASEDIVNKLEFISKELSNFIALKFPENTQIDVLINQHEGRN